MNIKYIFREKLKKEQILDQIKELVRLCDNEFLPPLSYRDSSIQQNFNIETVSGANTSIDSYFKAISTQSFILAVKENKVVGFMTFKHNYQNSIIGEEYQPNIYITTIITHPDFRNSGIATQFYNRLIKKYKSRLIFTRTWSTNRNHIAVLNGKGFHEFARIDDDRGENIDTVYFCREISNKTVFEIIKQYKLIGNFIFLFLIAILTIISLVIWKTAKTDVGHEIGIALFTSFIASIACLISDLLLKFKESKNDEYISKLKSFGIENLQFHKEEVLKRIIPSCKKELWISGYRFIMTADDEFLNSIKTACKWHKDIKIKVLAVAPWSEAFKNIYGDEDVYSNWFKVFRTMNTCSQNTQNIEIKVTNKVLFNDTYRVDDVFVTSPYLHCNSTKEQKILAKDFFSLVINDESKRLFKIVEDDYMTIWDKTNVTFNLMEFCQKVENRNYSDYTKTEIEKLIKGFCK